MDIYGNEVYYHLDDMYRDAPIEENKDRIDRLLKSFDDPILAIIVNRLEGIYPKNISIINSSQMAIFVARYE